ncbi:MAG: hypothetical protein ACKVSF_01335 [Alphaproteobacteria bacterium]
MNTSEREAAQALRGAYRLARFDARGLDDFDASPGGAWRSFFAAVLVAPGHALILAFHLSSSGSPESDGWHAGALHALAFAIEVAAYPLLMRHVAMAMGRGTRWTLFVAANNWSMVVQLGYHLAALGAVELLPGGAGMALATVLFGLVLAYAWFVARSALAIGGPAAAGVVLLDIALSFSISRLTDALT